jgi:hypothetical protein
VADASFVQVSKQRLHESHIPLGLGLGRSSAHRHPSQDEGTE